MAKRFESLDAFRGLCAICVVLYHMNVARSFTEFDFFNNSDIFVEFFFVLSGFVLAHGYGFKDKIKFIPFIVSRFFRLYPLHLVFFLVVFLIEIGKYIAFKYGGVLFNYMPFSGKNSLIEALPNLLLIQSWFSFASPTSFNGPSWSISVEFYLYIILFMTIAYTGRFKVWVWGVLAAAALFLSQSSNGILTDLSLRGMACFFGGVLTYCLYRKFSGLRLSGLTGSLVEVFLLLLVFYVVKSEFDNRFLIAVVLFCIVVFVFFFEFGVVSLYLKRNTFQLFGRLSYSIYLSHFSILFFVLAVTIVSQKVTGVQIAPTIGGERFIDLKNILLNNALVLIVLIFIIWVSNLTYKKVEMKWQGVGRGLLKEKTG